MLPKNIILVLDTETCDLQGNVYDVGFTVADKKGNILQEYTALVSEIFTDAEKMMGAFYARKLFTHYAPMLQDGEIRLAEWADIVSAIREAMEAHSVTTLAAYNLGFDRRVMTQTHKLLGNPDKVLARSVQQLDLWRFACETKLSSKTYQRIAIEQGWVSAAGNLKSGAEYAYRFCSGDFGFIEAHTALSDARIETEIMAQCYAAKKRVPYGIVNGAPWRLIQP